MTETKVLTIKVPDSLFKDIETVTKEYYLSKGEFVRSAVVKFLIKLGFLKPFSLQMRELRREMRSKMEQRGEAFSPEEEIEELRKIRGELWRKKYAQARSGQ